MVDGAHAPGFIDLNLADIPCDFYAGNCHKWLLAPTGAGFLYLGSGSEDRLQPMQVSWGFYPPPGSGPPDERDQLGSTPRLRRLEFEGTRDICPWLTVPEAIDFQSGFGPKPDPGADARADDLPPRAPDWLAGARCGYAGAPGIMRSR